MYSTPSHLLPNSTTFGGQKPDITFDGKEYYVVLLLFSTDENSFGLETVTMMPYLLFASTEGNFDETHTRRR
jgi:hypothetical protein